MRKKLLIGACLGVVGLAAGTVAVASASPDIASAQTIALTGHITQFTPLDLGATGPSQGDEFVFSGTLSNRSDTQVGHFGGYVVLVKTGTAAQGEASVTFALSGGQITFQNLQPQRAVPFETAVTGGTGMFKNARGEGTVTETSSTTFTVVLHLIPSAEGQG